MSALPDWSILTGTPVQQVVLVAVVVLSLAGVRRLSRGRRVGDVLRRRLVLGVPWGTLVTLVGVLAFYLVVQNGLENLRDPLVYPFIAWSYFYPLGVVTSPFAHAGFGHLKGNLMGTLLFAPVAEYAWSHFPRERGSQSFSSLRTNPFVRVLAVPAAAFVGGLLTGVFSLGPTIGFSGVVFAFVGFALVRYPLVTVLALVGRQVVSLLLKALQNPQSTASGHRTFVTPWWANVAIHGHYYGLLLGVVAALLLVHWRDSRPSAERLWFGVVVVAVSQGLWALYLPMGGTTYVVFRAAGTAVVFLLATAIAAAAVASDRTLIGRIDLSRREATVGVVVTLLLTLSVVAVPFNFTTLVGSPAATDGVEIRDYTVRYAEDAPNRYALAYPLPFSNESEQFNVSGVIVSSRQRSMWLRVVRKGKLARTGNQTITVGGIGWERTVKANRTGWQLFGNETTYKVYLRPENGRKRLVYRSEPKRARPVIAGRNVSIRPTVPGYEIVVSRRGRAVASAPIPAQNGTVRLDGLRFKRTGRYLTVRYRNTKLRIAARETH